MTTFAQIAKQNNDIIITKIEQQHMITTAE